MKVPEPRKLKSGTWFVQMRLNGVSVPVSAPTKQECKHLATLIKAEHKAGKRQISRSMLTFPEAVDKHVRERRNVLSPATIRNYKWMKETSFKSIHSVPLSKVSNWQAVIDEEAAKYAPKTVAESWALVLTVMKENGIPKPAVKLPQIVPKDPAFLDPDEIRKFVKALHGEPCEISAMLALHSLRRAEILGLTWENIDLKNGIIRIRGNMVLDENNKAVQKRTTKTKASRRDVPIMIPELSAALEAVPQEKRVGNVVSVNPATIWAQINRVCDKNNLPRVGVHGLRRSFASLAFSSEVGMTEREVMEIGGWDDANTMHKLYEQISKAQLKRASEKMRGFYEPKKIANENHNDEQKTV